jgi:selenocysteine-specific elongation factor
MRVVATAGHVDHGKSTLVRALTGTDPDRLAEERSRGMTIDLGFAWTTLPDGATVAFVDVPGHVDFLRNMIAGVASASVGLLVVDAVEGWRAQTLEHVTILRSLGVDRLVVAVTKADRARPEVVRACRVESADRAANAGWPGVPVVACDARSGAGLDDLRATLGTTLAATPDPVDRGRPRLWIDRSFALTGVGTVVTGGLSDGSLDQGEAVVVLTSRGAHATKVRGLESLGVATARAEPGSRTAANLAGLHHRRVGRSDVVMRDGEWHLTACVDVRLDVDAGLGHRVTRRGAYRAHWGTGAWTVRIQLLGGGASIEPGSSGLVRLHLPRPLPLLPGDRFVLTESGRGEVIGGGEALDVDPVLPPRRASPSRSVERVVRERGWVDVDELDRLTGHRVDPAVGRWVVDPGSLAAVEAELVRCIADAGAQGLALDALDERGRLVAEHLAAVGRCVIGNGAVRSPGAVPAVVDSPFLRLLDEHPFDPPDPRGTGVSPQELAALRRVGAVVSVEGIVFSQRAVALAAAIVRTLLRANPAGVTVAEIRDALGTTRKWALPLLAHLDAVGATRRTGEVRVAGGRLDEVAAGASGASAPSGPTVF